MIKIFICKNCSEDEPCRLITVDGVTPLYCPYTPGQNPTWLLDDVFEANDNIAVRLKKRT